MTTTPTRTWTSESSYQEIQLLEQLLTIQAKDQPTEMSQPVNEAIIEMVQIGKLKAELVGSEVVLTNLKKPSLLQKLKGTLVVLGLKLGIVKLTR